MFGQECGHPRGSAPGHRGLLARLQAAADRWIERGEAVRQKARSGAELTPDEQAFASDLAFARREGGEVFFRVDYLHAKGEAASLELLGSPQVLAVAESLCGPNFVPTYESMVFKKAGDGEKIPWHQDAVHPRRYRVFNYDLYLDPSRAGGGALRVVPQSQRRSAPSTTPVLWLSATAGTCRA